MSTQLQPSPEPLQPTPNEPKHSTRDRIIAGVALIAIGAVVFWAQISNHPELTWLIVPILGLIFLIWGLAARTIGLIIPGGILSGSASASTSCSNPALTGQRKAPPVSSCCASPVVRP